VKTGTNRDADVRVGLDKFQSETFCESSHCVLCRRIETDKRHWDTVACKAEHIPRTCYFWLSL